MRRFDLIVAGGFALLIVLTPVAIGSVHPLAYSIAEATLFLLVAVWMAKAALAPDAGRPGSAQAWAEFRHFATPLGLFFVLVAFQLAPLPARVLRTLSPSTYRLYSMSLPGWPARAPFRYLGPAVLPPAARAETEVAVLPTIREVQEGIAIPFAPPALGVAEPSSEGKVAPAASVSRPGVLGEMLADGWGSISIAPPLTGTGLLGWIAVSAAFFLAAFYPFGSGAAPRADRSFVRFVLLVVIATGTLVAILGLVERVYWNGRILWFFVPHDWGKAMFDPGTARARGPFVDPDHFAGYLAMVFPLALSGTVFPSFLTPRSASREFQIACGFSAFVLFTAVLLSASRAGWLGLALGACLVSAMVLASADEYAVLNLHASRSRAVGITLLGVAALLALALLFVGTSGQVEAEQRVRYMFTAGGAGLDRLQGWRGGIALVRDFPLLGVGLGTWPEIFTRYQPPPWIERYFSQAHNDYLQLLAETGLIGVALMGWFFTRIGRSLARRGVWLAPQVLPVFAALISGIAVMAVAEFFDFDLRIPANALLFALLLGLAVRLAMPEVRTLPGSARTRPRAPLLAVAAAASVLVLMVAALKQDFSVYPYNLSMAMTPTAARAMLLSYPANAYAHYVTMRRFGSSMRPEDRLRELAAIVFLDPTNPRAHDLYAQELERDGRTNEAFEQIKLSVEASPEPARHGYLTSRVTPWLSIGEKQAVEDGYKEAVARRYPHAIDGLGAFYDESGRFRDEAKLFADAAAREDFPSDRVSALVAAGDAYARAGDPERAAGEFRQAAAAEPDNIKPYQALITLLLKQPNGARAARAVADQGIDNGVDPSELLDALGLAAYLSERFDLAEAALSKSLEYRPSSFQSTLLLGTVYNRESKFDRAALTLLHALELESDSAQANWELGKAQEGAYHYFAAEQAYRRAIALDPSNASMRSYFADFQQRIAAGEKALNHVP